MAQPNSGRFFTLALTDKVVRLLDVNAAALAVKGVKYADSSIRFLRQERTLATSAGTFVTQTVFQSAVALNVTAIAADGTDFQSRESAEIEPAGLGYEHVTSAQPIERATEWAEEAVRKLSARTVVPGRYDLVLHPSNLWLTIHESIGHPTELDCGG